MPTPISPSAAAHAALLAGLALAAAGCAEERALMNPASGRAAPEFTLPDAEGRPWRLGEHRGRTLLINFWATWCAPCREEMPALERLHQTLGADGRFSVVGVHVGPAGDALGAFLAEVPVSFPILVDADLALANWDVAALPTTVLIGPEGRARYAAAGPREWDSEEALAFFAGLLP